MNISIQKRIIEEKHEEERAFFGESNIYIEDSIFDVGESPLKEASNVVIKKSNLISRYPLWYASDIEICETHFDIRSRAGLWYSKNITVSDSMIDAPKSFRRCKNIIFENCEINEALETFWDNEDITLNKIKASGASLLMGSKNVTILDSELTGDYLCLNTSDVKVKNLKLKGKYSFDGVKNLEITDSYLDTKDCVWNCENVIIKNCYIKSEYIGWNSKNVTFIDCTIESLQGFCYMENLRIINCKLKGTSLAFEYTTGEIEAIDTIDSVMNPTACIIKAEKIDKLIMDPTRIDINKTTIDAKIGERLDQFDGVIPGIPEAALNH